MGYGGLRHSIHWNRLVTLWINPKTGEKVTIKPKKLPFFKAGKELKERVNRINTPETW